MANLDIEWVGGRGVDIKGGYGSLLAQKVGVFACTFAHLLECIAQPELLLGQVVIIVVQHAGIGGSAGAGAGAVGARGVGVAVRVRMRVRMRVLMRVLAMIMLMWMLLLMRMLLKMRVMHVHVTIASRIHRGRGW